MEMVLVAEGMARDQTFELAGQMLVFLSPHLLLFLFSACYLPSAAALEPILQTKKLSTEQMNQRKESSWSACCTELSTPVAHPGLDTALPFLAAWSLQAGSCKWGSCVPTEPGGRCPCTLLCVRA